MLCTCSSARRRPSRLLASAQQTAGAAGHSGLRTGCARAGSARVGDARATRVGDARAAFARAAATVVSPLSPPGRIPPHFNWLQNAGFVELAALAAARRRRAARVVWGLLHTGTGPWLRRVQGGRDVTRAQWISMGLRVCALGVQRRQGRVCAEVRLVIRCAGARWRVRRGPSLPVGGGR